MAVVDRNSNVIANIVAVPRVLNNPYEGGKGVVQERAALLSPAADDAANSIHRICRIPSNASVREILLSTADATTGGAFNLGIYETAENGGAVVDADLFASAFALTNGPYEQQSLLFESGELTYAEALQPLWQALGLSADPHKEYDIALTISTTYNGAGTSQLFQVRFVQ